MRGNLFCFLTFTFIATLSLIIPQGSMAIEGKGQYAFSDGSTTTTYIFRDCMLFISVSPPEGGTTSPPPPQYFSQGCTPVTVQAISNAGFTFGHWEDDDTVISYNNPVIIDFEESGMLSIVAVFAKDSSTTTTTISDICPSEEIYSENSIEIELLRYIRDNVLIQSPEGQEIIKLYYQWSPAIVKAMKEDEEFKSWVKEMIDEILPLIKEAVE